MIRIAICDDEKDICDKVDLMVVDYCASNRIKVDISIFYDAHKLLEHVKNTGHFDLIFLDIEMDILSGIEFGNLIRTDLSDDDTRLVYISWKDKYAMDLFRIRPYHFLVKPIESHRSELEKILRDVNEELVKDKQFFHYQVGKNYGKEPYGNIVYFSSENRTVKIHTVNDNITFYSKLDQVEKEIEGTVFLRIHKSILVNTRHIKRFDAKLVYMDNGDALEISKSYRDIVNNFVISNWGG